MGAILPTHGLGDPFYRDPQALRLPAALTIPGGLAGVSPLLGTLQALARVPGDLPA